VTLVLAILNALIAIPQIAGYINTLVQGIIAWYVNGQTNNTLAAIADAAAFAAQAKTAEDRYAAAAKWKSALSSARYTN
jgi:hypothetical protein